LQSQIIYIEALFQNLKTLKSLTIPTNQRLPNAYLGQNSPKCCHFWATSSKTKISTGLEKWPNRRKITQSGHPAGEFTSMKKSK
jgi:hypothetical protein